MDTRHHTATPTQDLSPLAWVEEELRKSLEGAHRALRRFLKDIEGVQEADADTVDALVLRTARQNLHQSAGALDLVGLTAPARLLRASEHAVQRYVQKPARLTHEAVDAIERGSSAVLDYVTRVLRGRADSAVGLFPQYRAIQELAGADRIHPADLWDFEWRWADLGAADAVVSPRQLDPQTRAQFESDMLKLLRGTEVSRTAARLSDLCAGLAGAVSSAQSRTLWQLAAAFYESMAGGRIPVDVFAKRVSSRLLAQFAKLQRGELSVSDRLGQDLLFFCSISAGTPTPRSVGVLAAYQLQAQPVHYDEPRFGRFDPATLTQLRKRVAAAKDGWSAVAGGDTSRLPSLVDHFGLLGESIKRVYPEGETLAASLANAVARTVRSEQAPSPELAMEVATGVLYLEASLDEADLDNPELGPRMLRLADRLDRVQAGEAPEPLEGWMEELYRRASDRQTMGSVVTELRTTLSDIEKNMDPFFRDPTDRSVLATVPQRLNQMRGVLSVLGLDHASHAVLRMRDEIDEMIVTEVDPEQARSAGTFDRLAGNLGALSFLIDMLGYQPAMAKSLFTYDEGRGELRPVMGREGDAPRDAGDPGAAVPTLEDQALTLAERVASDEASAAELSTELARIYQEATIAEQPALAATARDAARNLASTDNAEVRARVAESVRAVVAPPAQPAAPAPAAGTDVEDEDLLAIFLEEAQEVVATGREALRALQHAPSDVQQLTTVRRAFHTLKGSSRMVGLTEFGEAAWACEQVLNAWLADQKPSDDTLLAFSLDALNHFEAWAADISRGRGAAWQSSGVRAAADALRLDGRLQAIGVLAARGGPSSGPFDHAETVPAAFELPGMDAPPTAPDALEPLLPLVLDDAPAEIDLSAEGTGPLDAPGPAGEAVAGDAAPDAVEEVGASTPQPLEDLRFEFNLDLDDLDDPDSGVPPVPEVMLHDEVEPALEPVLLELPELDDALEVDDELLPLPDTVALARRAPTSDDPPPIGTQATVDDPVHSDADADFDVDVDADADADATTDAPADVATQPMTLVEPTLAPQAEPISMFGPLDLDLDMLESEAAPLFPVEELQAAPMSRVDAETLDGPVSRHDVAHAGDPDEQVKVVGSLRISIPLFNIYLSEADEQSRRLQTELAEWGMETHQPVSETAVALAHSLAGSSSTVGFNDLSLLARKLEHALMKSQSLGRGRVEDANLFTDVAEEIRRLLHQFAAGFLRTPQPELLEALALFERSAAEALAARRVREEAPDSGSPRLDEAEGHHADSTSPWTERRLGVTAPADLADAPEALTAGNDADPSGAAASATGAHPQGDAPSVFQGTMSAPLEALPAHLHALEEVPQPAADSPERVHVSSQGLDLQIDEDIDEVDAVDVELFPIFEEEAHDLLPQLAGEMRHWAAHAADEHAANACMRTLHTLKGGARLAGAMRLGELAHRLESMIERLIGRGAMTAQDVEPLLGRVDVIQALFDLLQRRDAAAYQEADAQASGHAPLDAVAGTPTNQAGAASRAEAAPAPMPVPVPASGGFTPPQAPALQAEPAPAPASEPAAPAPRTTAPLVVPSGRPAIDWSRFVGVSQTADAAAQSGKAAGASAQGAVRVRAQLLDRLVNQAGEVSMARARMESEVGTIKGSLTDLTDNLERLRQQLRDIELQAETQMTTRMEAAKAASEAFDPLEFDRFTRFQEITRMMAESVNDVATVQRQLQRTLQTTEDELAGQARLTRELQSDLLRTRMVEFEGLSERLYRVVRQAAKETGKQVRLDIVGGSIEVDRGVLERMTPAFEHLLRNCVTHGIETADVRTGRGKDASGLITVSLHQEGNEVSVEFRDDGAGLDLARIRAKAVESGLLEPGAEPDETVLAALIFTPGFSTAELVTELAGRGVGMDVVRAEVVAMGGRIETATTAGQGTSFRLVLPLTTAVTQIVLLRIGKTVIGVPASLVEIVRRNTGSDIQAAYAANIYRFGNEDIPFFWLGTLLQTGGRGPDSGRNLPVLVLRSAQQRVAVHVDEVLGHQEVVVKNLGPQLSRLPGLAGMTLLASGAVTLIYNPVALAAVYGDAARALAAAEPPPLPLPEPIVTSAATAVDIDTSVAPTPPQVVAASSDIPLVLVVDDSLTVRRVTQRLLGREGYRVTLAKDGLEALEKLQIERPSVVLSDIEMPRMDGFDLLRNIRNDKDLRDLPVIMITSRIAQKHRDYADELGANHYLGKPYSEEELLALIGRYTRVVAPHGVNMH